VSEPLVSVVIPTRNGGQRLTSVLDAIHEQRHDCALELIAVDSGSTDGTLELLSRRVDVLLRIQPSAFNHGATRNVGIGHARGAFVVMLVQDAVPQSDQWLEALIGPMRRDPGIAGTFARQVPYRDASPLTRQNLATWIAAGPDAHTAVINDRSAYDRWSPLERMRACAFDNVCAAVRRSVWEKHPFPEVPIAEDLAWGRAVLFDGHALAYVPDAVVEHSHERSAWYELKRTWVLHQQLHKLFGVRTIPTLRHLARAVAGSTIVHWRCLQASSQASTLQGRLRAQALAVAWPLGQYLGGLTAANGHDGWRPTGV
jgi:rhamnosyltransferase